MKVAKNLIIVLAVLTTSLGHFIALSGQNYKHDTAISQYVYLQEFMPRQTLEIDLSKTAIFITDLQNDYISEGGAGWSLVGESVVAGKVV